MKLISIAHLLKLTPIEMVSNCLVQVETPHYHVWQQAACLPLLPQSQQLFRGLVQGWRIMTLGFMGSCLSLCVRPSLLAAVHCLVTGILKAKDGAGTGPQGKGNISQLIHRHATVLSPAPHRDQGPLNGERFCRTLSQCCCEPLPASRCSTSAPW